MLRKEDKLSAQLLNILTLAEGSIIFHAGGIGFPFEMSALNFPPTVGKPSHV